MLLEAPPEGWHASVPRVCCAVALLGAVHGPPLLTKDAVDVALLYSLVARPVRAVGHHQLTQQVDY